MSSCLAYPPMILQTMAGLSFFGSVSMLFSFLMFASIVGDDPYNGSFHYGGAIAIIGCLSCFITGLLVLQIQIPGSHNYSVREPSTTHNTTAPFRGSSSNATTTPSTGKRNFPPAKRVVQPKHEMAMPRNSNNTNANANAIDIEAFQPGTETITETILPDGTKKVVTTVIGVDGSTTVTETIVRTE